jgi:hypothetical protein
VIIGSEIRQKELMALRRGLFADVLPPMQREEKRKWSENLMTFEGHREEILGRLNDPVCVSAVRMVVFSSRNRREFASMVERARAPAC